MLTLATCVLKAVATSVVTAFLPQLFDNMDSRFEALTLPKVLPKQPKTKRSVVPVPSDNSLSSLLTLEPQVDRHPTDPPCTAVYMGQFHCLRGNVPKSSRGVLSAWETCQSMVMALWSHKEETKSRR